MTGRRVLILPLVLVLLVLSYVCVVTLARHESNCKQDTLINNEFPMEKPDYTKMEPEPTEIIVYPKNPLPADKKQTIRSTTNLQDKETDDVLDYDPEINSK